MTTLWLSKITADTRQRNVRRDLSDPRQLHRTLMNLIPDELGSEPRKAAGLLYRVENERNLIVQTQLEPTLQKLGVAYTGQSVNLGKRLKTIKSGDILTYKCTATPIKRKAGTEIRLDDEQTREWWQAKLTGAGLTINLEQADITSEKHVIKDWRTLSYSTLSGIGQVANEETLLDAVAKGIGRNKSYGAGLLTVLPYSR